MKKLNDNLIAIAEVLSDGEYHDGTTIGEQLNITRAAVWKAIKKLINYGIPIESTKGKGYAIEKPLLLLNKNRILENLNSHSFKIDVFEELESTNDFLKNYIHEKQARVCIAETQTNGKGRLQRQWHSPFGRNLYFSILYPLQKDISELAGLSLVTGLSLCQTLAKLYSLNDTLKIKWPNDIIVDHKKLAGILIEIQAESHGTAQAIIGIGLNVNMQSQQSSPIDQPWTSLSEITGESIDRNILCTKLLETLLEQLNQFDKNGLAPFIQTWKYYDALRNQRIHLKSGINEYSGMANGIGPQGHLVLERDDGVLQHFAAGDTTLLK